MEETVDLDEHSSWNKNGSLEDSDEEVQVQVDPDLMERMSIFEYQLTAVFDRQAAMATCQVVVPSAEIFSRPGAAVVLPIYQPHAYPCPNTFFKLPVPPQQWPQAPVMVRPSPTSDTKIRGIRYANDTNYQHFTGFCAGCILPMNTGVEAPGKSLVVDFESSTFVGSLLMRMRDIPALDIINTNNNADADADASQEAGTTSYFEGKRRRFQAVVKGKFKKRIRMSECVTGQIFERPAGELPARLVVRAIIKLVSTLAPQLEATLDGTQPRFLTPLVATAQTVLGKKTASVVADTTSTATATANITLTAMEQEKLRNYKVYTGALNMEDAIEEPHASDPTSLLQAVPGSTSDTCTNSTSKNDTTHKSSVAARVKARKKAFNHLSAQQAPDPTFDLDKEYTFEFFQHLLLFDQDELAVECPLVGKVGLAKPLAGQPLKFMSAQKLAPDAHGRADLTYLWSFDLWHASLYPYAAAAVAQSVNTRETNSK